MTPPLPHLRLLLQVSCLDIVSLVMSCEARLGRVILVWCLDILVALAVVRTMSVRGFAVIEYVLSIPGQDSQSETATHTTAQTAASVLEWRRTLGIDPSGGE